jgi:DNA-binding transcriptional LysR family regulator
MLARCVSKDWVVGTMDHMGQTRPLELLQERVIDAYLSESSLDLPSPDDPTWTVIPLWRYPVALVAHPNHPLARVTGLSLHDLLRFPVPPLPAACFPVASAVLERIGLPIAGADDPPPLRYDSSDWEGRTADQVTLSYSTPFGRQIHPALRALESAPLLTNGGALICRRDVAAHGVMAQLVADLRTQLAKLAPSLPGLELLP